jgi:RHS repeat-associated protein
MKIAILNSLKNWNKILSIGIMISLVFTSAIGVPSARAYAVRQPEAGLLASSDTQSAYAPVSFTHPEPRTGLRPAQNNPEMTFDAQLLCTNDYCTDKNPGYVLTEKINVTKKLTSQDSSVPAMFNFKILCEGTNCSSRDIFYRVVNVAEEWSSPYFPTPRNTTVYAVGKGQVLNGTGYVEKSCGIGFSGNCNIGTEGVISAGIISGNPTALWHVIAGGGMKAGSIGIGDTEHRTVVVQVALHPSLLDLPIQGESTNCGDACGAQGTVGDPVNTATGSISYPTKDLIFATSAGVLSFERFYISSAVGKYTSPLGYGWTHNQDIRLIFSTSPGGVPGFVLFKDSNGNIYRFWDTGDGRYIPYAGVTASLTKNGSTPVTYTLLDQKQNQYLFNAQGIIQSKTDPEGRAFTYSYDANNRLSRVSADSASRYLDFSYDGQGRLVQVQDHTTRSLAFEYNQAGDLSAATDLVGRWTYTYDSEHHLLTVVDPDSHQKVRNEYFYQYPAEPLNFNNYTITTFANGDGTHTMTIEDGGKTLHLTGKASKKIDFPYNITKNTILEFDFKSPIQGAMHAIGFEQSNTKVCAHVFKLYGSQTTCQISAFADYADSAPNWKHYRIPLRNYYGGKFIYLFFISDKGTGAGSDSYFSNIRVYEENVLHGRVIRQYNGLDDLVVDLDYHAKSSVTRYEAETGTLNNAQVKSSNNASNGQYVGSMDYSDSYVQWTVNVPNEGEYLFTVGYTAGAGVASDTVLINGNSVPNVNFGNTTKWTTSMVPFTVSFEANLNAGANTIRLTRYQGSAELDYLDVSPLSGTTYLTDALGNVTVHAYNEQDALVRITDPLGNQVDKTYDGNFRPAAITDASDSTSTLVWSEDGVNLTKVVDAEGYQTDITYNSLNLPVSIIDPRNYETTFTYNGTKLISSTNPLNQTTTYAYNAQNLVSSITDDMGHVTSFTYDVHGQILSTTDPTYHTWTFTYASLGQLVNTIDPLGHVTHNEYDSAGRLTIITQNYDTGKIKNQDNEWNIVTEYAYDVRGNRISVTDTYNHVTSYEYNDADQLVKEIDSDGNETTNAYDAAGQLITTTDALNHATHYAYDDAGRLIEITDALGHTASTELNADGTIASTTDPLGRVTSYTYDDIKRVLTVTLPNGAVINNTYDESVNLISKEFPQGNFTDYEYDALNRLIKTIDPLGNFTESFFDDAGRLIQTKDARRNATSFGYDATGRLTSVTDSIGNLTTYLYDALGRRISMTDARDNETTFAYDEMSRNVEVTDALDNTSSTSYDALGQIVRITDANDNATTFTYDALGQLRSITDPQNNVTSATYDAVGNILAVTDANLHTTSAAYDVLNRLISVTDANGNTVSRDYDAAGNLISSTDGLGQETTYAYESMNLPIRVTDPLGHETEYKYNSRGDLYLMSDAEGVETKYEYDAMARLTAVTENADPRYLADHETNVRTEYTYDENGNRLSVKDGNNYLTTYTYDALNRLVSEKDPLNNIWTTSYDSVGNKDFVTDANGATTQYVYDNVNRLVTTDYPFGTDVSFTYDDAGRRLTMIDGLGTTTWTYNSLNQVTAITDPFNKTVQYGYDAAGNRTGIIYPDEQSVSYTYDPANRLVAVDGLSASAQYTYDDANRLTLIQRPNNVNSAYTYDAADNLLSITHANGMELLSSFQYTYDAVGNRLQSIEEVMSPEMPSAPSFAPELFPTEIPTELPTQTDTPFPTETPAPTETAAPTQTPTDIPTETPETTPTETPTSGLDGGFALVGYKLSSLPQSRSDAPASVTSIVTISYTYDPLYRLTAADYSSGEYYHYTYDEVGNRLSQTNHLATTSYTYTSNKLSSISGENLNVAFHYNGLGDRLSQTVNGVTTYYALDQAAPLTQVLSDGTNDYLYGLDRIAQVNGSVTEYFLTDALGSVRQLADGNGAVTLTKGYQPFGTSLTTIGNSASIYGFSGEQQDLTGLTYLRARYYSSAQGRFLTRDTWDGDTSRPMSFNRWVYVNGNPINYTDPSGFCPQGNCSSQQNNPRNLTSWLYRAMIANANSQVVRNLRVKNDLAMALLADVSCDLSHAALTAMLMRTPVSDALNDVIVARMEDIYNIAYLHGTALYDYSQLVKNGAPWDFKDEVGIRLGPGITLCANGICYDDIEYSVVGNIHFAYIGIVAGIQGWEIQAGAGYAEIADPAHDPGSIEYTGPYQLPDLWQLVGWTPWDLSTINFGDDPIDHEAVTCGIKMGSYGASMSRSQFESQLAKCISKLARHSPRSIPVDQKYVDFWPYPYDYFNNQGNVYNIADEYLYDAGVKK